MHQSRCYTILQLLNPTSLCFRANAIEYFRIPFTLEAASVAELLAWFESSVLYGNFSLVFIHSCFKFS